MTLPHVKFLLVDDLEENLLAIEALLRRDDLEIFTARSGAAALELLREHDFALALLDVQMPGMNGFELAETMRGSERTQHVPLIFLTADAYDRNSLFKGYETGAVDFLYKPVNPYILRNKAEVFFQLYRQKQQLAEQLDQRTGTLRTNEMFTAVLGHDLRNPLNAIITSAHLLQTSEDELVRLCGQRITSSGRRMSRMIDDMLDMARMRLGGGINVVRDALELGALVERIVEEQQMAQPEARIALRREGDLLGRWDGARIAQAASNLINNALRHGAAEEAVDLCLDGRDPRQVTVSITNAGGIAPELRERIFEPFQGAQREAGGGKRGLGLGLYIVKQIVEAHEGEIAVRCAEGHTNFRVVLPRGMPAN